MRLPPTERVAWLDDRCARDAALRQDVERVLLEQDSRTLVSNSSGDSASPAAGTAASSPAAPSRMGPYRILKLLGEGGMGVVYLAEQERPRRTVALKVIRPGLLTASLLRRFDLETQSLARLQHPGIAQVYEAGTFEFTGGQPQPYFAMEYVQGRPLNEYASAAALPVTQRIGLFGKVCDAVQHAHQRGVIHRDLKSANILVTDSGEPKILDFGVAKLAEADNAGSTVTTQVGQIVGTVPYMSPEQIAGRPDDVDTRSDVYTLGVILFELLSGRLPHAVNGRTLVEASQIIARQQAARLGSLSGEFRGDLETIVAKAIDKDRDRRYQSPAELASDLERYLTDQPILARPPSTIYQLRKFARRNEPVVIAGGVAAAVLALGVAGVTWQALEATRGRALAERLRVAADQAKLAAIKEARTTKEINSLLIDMLQSADPDVSLGRELTVVEVVDRTAATIGSTVHEPHVLASVRSTLAATYQNLNKLVKAEEQARATLALAEREFGPDSPDTLDAIRSLADILADQGRFSEAQPLADDALDRARRRFGLDAPETVGPMIAVSRILHESGKVAESRLLLNRAVDTSVATLGERHPDTLFAQHNMASSLKDEGRFDEAIAIFEKVIDARREIVGPNHSQTLSSMNNLAGTLQKAGRNQEALAQFARLYEIRRSIFGETHASTLTSLSNLAVCHIALKRLDEAEPLLHRALDGYLGTIGESHNKTLITMASLAFLEQDRGRLDEAERLFRRVIEVRTDGPDPNVPELLTVMNNLAMLLHERGRADEAATVFADLMPRCRLAWPSGHYVAAIFASNYGECLRSLGRFGEAEPLLRRSLTELEASLGPTHARTDKTRERLASLEAQKPSPPAQQPAATPGQP